MGRVSVQWRAKLSDVIWPLALCIVAIFFGAQAFRYSGIVGRLGEWQFGDIQVYYPGLTVFLLLALVMLPVALLVFLLRRRRLREARKEAEQAEALPIELRYRHSIGTTTVLAKSLYFLAVAAALGFLVCVLMPFAIDSGGRAAQLVDLAERLPADAVPSKLNGRIDSRHIALLRRGIGFVHHDVYVAPLILSGVPATTAHRYFAEVAASNLDNGSGAAMIGSTTYLRRTSLPLQLVALYESRGVAVANDPVMLFSSRESRDWPYYIAAIQLFILAILSVLLAGIFQWRRRRLRDQMTGLSLPTNRITRR